MSNVKKVEVKTIPLNTALIFGLIALVVGFLAGNIYNMYKSGSSATAQAPSQNIDAQTSGRMFALEREVENNPGNQAAWLELGNLYFDTGKYQDAIRAYKKHLSLPLTRQSSSIQNTSMPVSTKELSSITM
jgi:cytochrome c-type biogenesis protein CcmH/NrfG